MRRAIASAASLLLVIVLGLTPGRAHTPVFAPHVSVGSGATEPGIHIAPDGTIFVDGPSGVPAHSKLWRSADGGTSFEAVRFSTGLSRLPGGGDSDVAIRVTPNGQRIYFLDLWAGSNSISVSEDNGETWTTGTPFTSLPLSDRQWIALGPVDPVTGMDTVYVLYALIQPPRQVMVARSRTGGLTWDAHVPAPSLLGASGFTGQMISDEQGLIGFAWEDGGGLRVAWSRDEGLTWEVSAPVSILVGGLIPGVTLDGDVLHVVWVNRLFWSIEYAAFSLTTRTWTEVRRLSDEGGSNVFPWVDARAGKVAVAWYAAPEGVGPPDEVDDDVTWDAVYRESLDGGQSWSNTVAVGFGKAGSICISGLDCDLNGTADRNLGDFLSLAIGPESSPLAGRSVVGFGGRVAGGVKVAVQQS